MSTKTPVYAHKILGINISKLIYNLLGNCLRISCLPCRLMPELHNTGLQPKQHQPSTYQTFLIVEFFIAVVFVKFCYIIIVLCAKYTLKYQNLMPLK